MADMKLAIKEKATGMIDAPPSVIKNNKKHWLFCITTVLTCQKVLSLSLLLAPTESVVKTYQGGAEEDCGQYQVVGEREGGLRGLHAGDLKV